MTSKLLAACVLTMVATCSPKQELLFHQLDTAAAGITFENTLQDSTVNILDYLYFYNGGGVALGDINHDGLPDIYLTGNQTANKLFLNKGNLTFEDITGQAGVAGHSSWNTGATMVDVDGDGWLDIYVCAVVGINGFEGHNELFINQGDGTFAEEAARYGLAFENYSTNAAWLDYDLDGDLDMYLLNHAIHTQHSFGQAAARTGVAQASGDKLLRNDGGTFVNVSQEAGIYSSPQGYGLGVAVADLNLDGYPDLYVSNDFAEDDYYYVNQGDGTFAEQGKAHFGHLSRFSMGNEVADINHDGYPDVLTLDMLPEAEDVLKASMVDDNLTMLQLRTQKFGYHYQFSRNMLHLNQTGQFFSEVALQSKVAATDWSWSPLLADFNQDGEQDIFIANGIPKRPNDLDYIRYISNPKMQQKLNNTRFADRGALEAMPSGQVANYFFEGTPSLSFIDQSATWTAASATASNGAAYADLDSDGDLDIVTNNLNAPPTVYVNQTNGTASYLTVRLAYKAPNAHGIGTKVYAYSGGQLQYKEHYTARGFQSTSADVLHFGFGQQQSVDSLLIVWPDQARQHVRAPLLNETLLLSYAPNAPQAAPLPSPPAPLFSKVPHQKGIDFVHQENRLNDFDLHRLLPYKVTDRGTATAVGDIDHDGHDDVLFGGSNRTAAGVYRSADGQLQHDTATLLLREHVYEDVDILIEDFDGDGRRDVFSLSGGGFFATTSRATKDQLFLSTQEGFRPAPLPDHHTNGTVACAADFDNDGRTDIFVGAGSVPDHFGQVAPSYILQNTAQGFRVQIPAAFRHLGMLTDALCTDFNGDGRTDLLVVGEWMPPRLLENTGEDFVDVSEHYLPAALHGLWQSVTPFDIDADGDTDYLLGNWGLNTKFRATADAPMTLYCGDFDKNGSWESILAMAKEGRYYPFASLDALTAQLTPLVGRKFQNHTSFAGKTLFEVFDKALLEQGKVLQVHCLASGYLQNQQGRYQFVPFVPALQVAPITRWLVHDFDQSGGPEALAAGNYFGLTPFQGRHDGFGGAMLYQPDSIVTGQPLGLDFFQKQIMALNILTIDKHEYLLVSVNNDSTQLYAIEAHAPTASHVHSCTQQP